MSNLKWRSRFTQIASSAAAVLAFSALLIEGRGASIIYDFAGTHDTTRAAGGFNYGYIGDDVTATAPDGGSYRLETISMRFGQLAYTSHRYEQEGISDFTPAIELRVFPIDPASRRPTGPEIGIAYVTNQTFSVARVDEGSENPQFFTHQNLQNATFDFSGQGVILPEHFGFAYRVTGGTAADGTTTDEMNFFASIASSSNEMAASAGGTVHGSLVSYPNTTFDPNRFAFDGEPSEFENPDLVAQNRRWSVDNNMIASVTATFIPVPEPGTMSILAVGGLACAGLRRRREPSAG